MPCSSPDAKQQENTETEMGWDWDELNLLGSGFLPKTMSDFLTDLSMIDDDSVKATKLSDYLHVMEDELRKIGAFKCELPFCMLLLNDALERLQKERVHCTEREVRPVMTEFLPLKGNSEEEEEDAGAKRSIECSDMKNWMSSAQLWTTGVDQFEKLPIKEHNFVLDPEPQSEKEWEGSEFGIKFETKLMEHAELALSKKTELSAPFHGGLSSWFSPMGSPDSDPKDKNISRPSYRTWGVNRGKEPLKKQRRCWSPELHRQFVDALERLGGAHKATPKQIKELMDVEGLTNDEIKSHLQKYRLHVRKVIRESSTATAPSPSPSPSRSQSPSPSRSQSPSPSTSPSQSYMIWLTQEEYIKAGNSISGSAEGRIQLGESSKGVSITCGGSMEYEEDEKSESHSWRGLLQKAF